MMVVLALGFCMPLALSGCGDSSNDAQVVKVEKSENQKGGKDALMEFGKKTLSQQKGQHKAKY